MTTSKHYWNRLKLIAAQSHDPDTQTACTIVSWRGYRRTVDAANRLPDGLTVTPERLTRPAKYSHIQHAERRAIATAAREGIPTWNATMYLNWFPCNDCAIDIIQAGIRALHVDKAAYETRKDDPRYGFSLAMDKLLEDGVRLVWH